MFFLKELPTQEMLGRYAKQYPEMEPDQVDAALVMMRRASLLIRELERLFASVGLSQTRFLVLMLLDREPGEVSLALSELAERLDVSKPVVTTSIKALVADDFILMEASDADARSKRATLQPAGKAKLNELLPRYFTTIASFMGDQTIKPGTKERNE